MACGATRFRGWLRRASALGAACILVTACGGDTMGQSNIKELIREDAKVGTGAEAVPGRQVTVHYTGWLYDEGRADHKGRKFDSSRDRNEPFEFTLGRGEVIKGWDQGVAGMKIGGVRKLTIPPEMAYGDKGFSNLIPPNSTLVFEVELLSVK